MIETVSGPCLLATTCLHWSGWCAIFPQLKNIVTWTHFPYYWPFVLGIHWLPVDSQHKGLVIQSLVVSLVLAWISFWTNSQVAGEMKCLYTHPDEISLFDHGDDHSSLIWMIVYPNLINCFPPNRHRYIFKSVIIWTQFIESQIMSI